MPSQLQRDFVWVSLRTQAKLTGWGPLAIELLSSHHALLFLPTQRLGAYPPIPQGPFLSSDRAQSFAAPSPYYGAIFALRADFCLGAGVLFVRSSGVPDFP